jgi:hypothetical protein
MPVADRFKHGTRSRYVCGCRCDACRASNAAYYHERQAVCKALASAVTASGGPVTVAWTPPGQAQRTRTFTRSCPGVLGDPCAKLSHLRKDSTGGVCSYCRLKLGWDGLVDAAPARAHLEQLSEANVGRRAVHDATGCCTSLLMDIRAGRKKKIRRSTLNRILAVDVSARADASLVPAAPFWALVDQLMARGWRQYDLARAMGLAGTPPQMPWRKRTHILARTMLRIERLARTIGEPPEYGTRWKPKFCDCLAPKESDGRCGKCGHLERPDGMTQALVAGGPEKTKPVHRAFGFEGGWGFEQRQSKAGKKREEVEMRELARPEKRRAV